MIPKSLSPLNSQEFFDKLLLFEQTERQYKMRYFIVAQSMEILKIWWGHIKGHIGHNLRVFLPLSISETFWESKEIMRVMNYNTLYKKRICDPMVLEVKQIETEWEYWEEKPRLRNDCQPLLSREMIKLAKLNLKTYNISFKQVYQ